MGAARSKGVLEPYTSFDAFPTEYIKRKVKENEQPVMDTMLYLPPPTYRKPIPVLIKQQPVPITPVIPIVPVLRPRYRYHRNINIRSPIYQHSSVQIPISSRRINRYSAI
jgi:hypothetical protein